MKPHRFPRDQERTPFAEILEDLVRRFPGARAAILVDSDGECVDYAGDADPFDLKVAGAHFRIVLGHHAPGAPHAAQQIVVVGSKAAYVARLLPEAYALVVSLARRGALARSRRALAACEAALCEEAAWTNPSQHRCLATDVVTDNRGRPLMLRLPTAFSAVEILGTRAPSPRCERAYRVRLDSGEELDLVREPRGHWYIERA